MREGSGFPPFTMAAMRTLVAGAILLLASGALRHRLRLTRAELGVLIASGTLLWLGGNGLVVWAEQHAGSGYAAVIVGSTPLWVAIITAFSVGRTQTVVYFLHQLITAGKLPLYSGEAMAKPSLLRASSLRALAAGGIPCSASRSPS